MSVITFSQPDQHQLVLLEHVIESIAHKQAAEEGKTAKHAGSDLRDQGGDSADRAVHPRPTSLWRVVRMYARQH